MWQSYLVVALGGALGSVARLAISSGLARHWPVFPVGTLAVNATGSVLIGYLAAVAGPDGRLLLGPLARQFLLVGFLGGYTTFSSFSLQTLTLAQEGQWRWAALNVTASLLLCLGGAFLGQAAATWINR